MKMKKTKILSVIFIGFFFMLITNPFINGETHTQTLAPNTYLALGTNLQVGDTVNFEIESSQTFINVYIMDEDQMNSYLNDPQDEASWYTGREYWHYFVITSSFIAQHSQKYYVLMINPSDSTSTYVVIDLTIDKYIQKTITITNPTNIDTFNVGDVYITWTSTGSFDYVKIDLYENGVFLKTITSATDNDGSYNWYIYISDDYIDGSNYQIKIIDYDDNSIYDYSDYFSIEVKFEEPDLYEPNYFLERLFWWLLIILVPVGIVIVVILIRMYKKSHKESIIQEKVVPKITYCSECGTEIDKERIFCSNCGNKVKK